MKTLKYISIFLVALFIFTSCSPDMDIQQQDEGVEIEVVEETPSEGGTLVLSSTRFKTLNPVFNRNENLFQIHHLIYESLVTFNEDMTVKPLLAEKWSFNNGEKSVDFTLKDGVYWHDGEKLTSDDVVFTFNTIKGNIKGVSSNSLYRQSLEPVINMVKVDERTVRATFSKQIGNALEIMTFPILPEHVYSGNNSKHLDSGEFIAPGTGPYKLMAYENMRNMDLSRNEQYWGKKPYIENVQVIIVPDDEAQRSLFENGEIDVIYPNIVDWEKYADEKKTNSFEFVMPNYEFLGVNFRTNILQNISIRRAIAYTIDRERIATNIYLGHGTIVDFPIMPNSWLYDHSKIRFGLNTTLADQLLEQAGYTLKENAEFRTNEAGDILRIRLITNADNPLREQTAIFIQEDLKKVGIKLEVEFLEKEEYQKQMYLNTYDLFLGGWELSYIPDLTFAFHSSKIGGTNFIGYNNEELNTLLAESLENGDSTRKKEKFSALEEQLTTEVPYISLFFRNGAIIVKDKIKGDLKPQSYNIFSNIEDWFINVKEASK